MANPINRSWYNALVDDDGSGTTGTVWNKSQVNGLLNAVDASLATVVDKAGGSANQLAIFQDADTIQGSARLYADLANGGLVLDSPSFAYLQMGDQSQPADGKLFRIINAAGKLTIGAITDGGVLNASVEIMRGGRLNVQAGQISFPVSRNPSADLYTLDDYREQVSWTPFLWGATGGATGQVYVNQYGRALKIGGFVYAYGALTLSALGTIVGPVQMFGLPFPIGAGTVSGHVGPFFGVVAPIAAIDMLGNQGNSNIEFWYMPGGGSNGYLNLQPANLTNTLSIYFTLVYPSP